MISSFSWEIISRFNLKFTLLVALILVAACASSIDQSQPPEIFYGEDVCAECGMIISDPRFAAAYYTTDGGVKHFDDIGGMLAHHVEHQEKVTQFWVHDFDNEQWVKADLAYFVMSNDIHSPMNYGIVAFSGETQAKEFALENNAMVMSFETVMESFKADSTSHEHSDS